MPDNQEVETPEPADHAGVNKGGRPELELDESQIERLAELQCSLKEIAYVMGCHTETLRRRYSDNIEAGKAQGKVKLRRAMFQNAVEKMNPALQIFLAKNLLNMSDTGMNSDDDNILPWQD